MPSRDQGATPSADPPASLVAYVRPVAEQIGLDVAIQRTAVRACARGEGLGTPEVFEEAEAAGRTAFAHIAHLAREHFDAAAPPPPRSGSRVERTVEQSGLTVVAATLAVLGDTALERNWRVLLLEAYGARLVLADGLGVEAALRTDWEGRPETERRRERAREGMRAKALRAQVLGRPPYGYVVKGRSLEPHPRESQVVKRIFEEYVEGGEGLRRIAASLNRDGIQTRLGRQWTPGSVRTVLRNPVYTGVYRRLGVTVTSAHQALIDRATFSVVQRRMVAKRTSRLEQERHEYLLGGLLRCGACGSLMIGERRNSEGGVTVAYRCERASSQGRCQARSVREDVVEAQLREDLGTGQHPVAARATIPHDSVARWQRLERRLTESVERWISGEWRYSELVRRVARLVRALHEEESPASEPLPGAEAARRGLLREWDALDFGERRMLIQAAVAEVVVERRGVRVTLRR